MTNIVFPEHAHAFRATVTDGSVSVSRLESETLSDTVTRVTLELHARSARAVLLLNVLGSGNYGFMDLKLVNTVDRIYH